MATKKQEFTLEDSDRMIKDVIDSFFQEQNVTHDLEELMAAQGNGEVPPGYHRMPDTGELMLDSEMAQEEVV